MPAPFAQPVIRQADLHDVTAISRFMDESVLVHRNLDWQPLLEWVDREPFLLRLENEKISALLSCAPDPEGIAWIHAFAMNFWSSDINKIWLSLLQPAILTLTNLHSNLYSVSLYDWFSKLLKETGFTVLQNIVVLNWSRNMPPALLLPPEVLIRPMEPGDIDEVAGLDQQVFEPIWAISRVSLENAYTNAEHTSVAEIDGKIIGYELSTADHLSAHLTRLAVLPGYTHANIGYTLTREMFEFFTRRGIHHITVNTQDNNTASISLYKKLGFSMTSDTFPVFSLKVS